MGGLLMAASPLRAAASGGYRRPVSSCHVQSTVDATVKQRADGRAAVRHQPCAGFLVTTGQGQVFLFVFADGSGYGFLVPDHETAAAAGGVAVEGLAVNLDNGRLPLLLRDGHGRCTLTPSQASCAFAIEAGPAAGSTISAGAAFAKGKRR